MHNISLFDLGQQVMTVQNPSLWLISMALIVIAMVVVAATTSK